MTYRITLPTVGKGTQADPIRVDMPHYTFVSSTPDGRFHTIDVPDTDVPNTGGLSPVGGNAATVRAVDLLSLSTRDLLAWAAFLDERYREHAGRFRPKGQ